MNDTVIFDDAQIILNPEYEYTFTATKKTKGQRNYPLFRATGYSYMNRGKHEGYPFHKVLLSLSKPEQQFMTLVLDNLDMKDNLSPVPKELLPTWDAVKLSRVYTSLKKRGLIKRHSTGVYMLNPGAMFNPATYEQVKARWDELP